jgi:signal transduction histidine kinase
MIKQGLVGTGGSTAKVLEESLTTMRVLIDRSLSEVRMGADNDLLIDVFSLNTLIDQILLTTATKSDAKKQVLESDIADNLEIETDRQLFLSIIANLVQNAIKYTKQNGHILLSVSSSDNKYIIKVQDECGGLDKELADNLFEPFVSGETDKSGLGLGLTIVKRATALLQGKISVHNNPGRGCTFVLDIPKKYETSKSQKVVTHGKDSVQPKLD